MRSCLPPLDTGLRPWQCKSRGLAIAPPEIEASAPLGIESCSYHMQGFAPPEIFSSLFPLPPGSKDTLYPPANKRCICASTTALSRSAQRLAAPKSNASC